MLSRKLTHCLNTGRKGFFQERHNRSMRFMPSGVVRCLITSSCKGNTEVRT